MATLNELIYDVRERLSLYSDDSNESDEHIAFLLKNFRNTLLQQYMSNLRNGVPVNALQVICLEMDVDKNCFDFDVVKSKKKIPTTITGTGRNDIHRVHSPGSRFIKNINMIDYGRMPFLHGGRFIGSQLYVSVDHFDYLIGYNTLDNHILLEKLQVEGVFEDPELAYSMSCENTDVDFEETQFPVPEDLLIPLVNEVTNILRGKKGMPVDNQNNGEDIVVGQAKQ